MCVLTSQAGMIDTENLERRKRKNAWAGRFDERNLESAHVGQALEEGEEGDNYAPQSEAERIRLERRQREGLWDDGDAGYYAEGTSFVHSQSENATYADGSEHAPNQQHWHYPANFEGAEPPRSVS
jgi:hypothetical protein